MLNDGSPIFLQLAETIQAGILDGTYPEESQVPSTNEFAAYLRINPATAGKGMALLVERGILYKKRGIGMFVATGARAQLIDQRRRDFAAEYLTPLLREAAKLGLSRPEIVEMIQHQDGTP